MAGQTVVVSVLADTKKFTQGFKELSSGSFVSGITNGFRRIGSAVEKAMLAGIVAATALGSLLAGIAIKGGLTRLLDIEDAQAKLRGLGHDTKTVDRIMSNALASVKGTAFGLGEAATVAASAVAAGVQPGQDLERTLKLVADASTIAGTDMGEMGLIFNKVAASNRLTMMEINQLHSRGVPILQMIADQYGVTAEEASNMVSQGKVDFETFRTAIEDNIAGAALEGGNTTRGAFKNMQAALHRVGANLLSGVFPLFVQFFKGIIDRLGPVEERAKEIGDAFAAWVEEMIPRVQTAIQNRLLPAWRSVSSFFTDTLVPAMQSVRDWFREHRDEIDQVARALGPAAAIVASLSTAFLWLSRAFRIIRLVTPVGLILALATALVYAWQNSETFRDVVSRAWETVRRIVESAWNNGIKPVIDAFAERWGTFWPRLKETLETAWDTISTIFGDIASGLLDNEGGWEGWGETVDEVVDAIFDVLDSLLVFVNEKLAQLERWWGKHGDDVVRIVTFAWNLVKTLFIGGLQTISGLIQVFTGIMTGDWRTFWAGMGTLNRAGWNNMAATSNDTAQRIYLRFALWLVNLRREFRNKWNDIVAFLRTIPSRIASFFQGLPDRLARIGAAAARALVNGIVSNLGSGARSAIGTAINSVLPGVGTFIDNKIAGRQHGGPVSGGRPYIVGEAGPELFVPHGSGTVVPNHDLGGGVTVNVALSRDAIAGIAQVEIRRGDRLLKRQVLAGAGVV